MTYRNNCCIDRGNPSGDDRLKFGDDIGSDDDRVDSLVGMSRVDLFTGDRDCKLFSRVEHHSLRSSRRNTYKLSFRRFFFSLKIRLYYFTGFKQNVRGIFDFPGWEFFEWVRTSLRRQIVDCFFFFPGSFFIMAHMQESPPFLTDTGDGLKKLKCAQTSMST